MQAKAQAGANIALVKYWGKRDKALNLPAVSSLSMTLNAMKTTTSVTFDESLSEDELILNGRLQEGERVKKVSKVLTLFRKRAKLERFAHVETENSFPTASGLASSASGFAALALAASAALGLKLPEQELADFARRGSGSAARSLLGGLVLAHAGEAPDGEDFAIRQLLRHDEWDLAMVVCMLADEEKTTSSTIGMNHTAHTSPYYDAWIHHHEADIQRAQAAIEARSFAALGAVSEHSAMKMHALMMAAAPPLIYWKPETLRLIHEVTKLRKRGIVGYYTIDAGAHVKVLCRLADAAMLKPLLEKVEGVKRVVVETMGEGARLL